MNSDIIYEISKYTNVNNLLLVNKEMFEMRSEQIIKNIEDRNSKDFVHIESLEAISYLINRVINKNRFDLLRKFTKVTPYRKLALIVCASVFLIKSKEEISYETLKLIMRILKCNEEELLILYILIKHKIDLKLLTAFIQPKHRNEVHKRIYKYKNLNILEYINEMEQVCLSPHMRTNQFDSIKFNKSINELVMYKEYLKNLIFEHNIGKEYLNIIEDPFNDSYMEHNSDFVETAEHLLKKYGKMFLVEFSSIVRSQQKGDMSHTTHFYEVFVSILCRKVSFDEISSSKLKLNFSSGIFFSLYFEAYKYNNINLVKGLLSIDKSEEMLIYEDGVFKPNIPRLTYQKLFCFEFFLNILSIIRNQKLDDCLLMYKNNQLNSNIMNNTTEYFGNLPSMNKFNNNLITRIIKHSLKMFNNLINYKTFKYYQDDMKLLGNKTNNNFIGIRDVGFLKIKNPLIYIYAKQLRYGEIEYVKSTIIYALDDMIKNNRIFDRFIKLTQWDYYENKELNEYNYDFLFKKHKDIEEIHEYMRESDYFKLVDAFYEYNHQDIYGCNYKNIEYKKYKPSSIYIFMNYIIQEDLLELSELVGFGIFKWAFVNVKTLRYYEKKNKLYNIAGKAGKKILETILAFE